MANLNVTNGKFVQDFTITKQNTTVFALSTSGTYVDKNIELTANVRSASASLSVPAGASISSLSYTYNTTSGKFDVTGSSNISGTAVLSVSQAGWLGGNISQAVSGTASLSGVSIPKVGINAALSGATSARKPSISKQDTPDGVTNAASGAATTSAPTSGVYVAVKSGANTATITATPAVASTGYGTTVSGQYTASTTSTTVGAAASDMTYIPIINGSITVDAVTATQAPSVSIDSTTGLISSSYSKAVSVTAAVATPGWVSNGANNTVTISGSKTLQLTTKAATSYNVSTSDQTIAAGTYLTGAQTFKAVSTTGISAENIKYGIVMKVGDSASAGRIKDITGTFTKANTVSSGQTAAAAGQILSGYSAWVDAAEVKGNIPIRNGNNVTVDSAGNSITVQPGYYSATATKSLSAGSITPNFSNSGLSTYFNTSSTSSSNVSITPNYTSTAGFIGTNSTAVNGTPAYYNIKTTSRSAGTGYVSLTAGSGNVTFAVGTGDSENSNNTSMSVATSTPSSGVYYKITVTGKGTVSGTGRGVVSTGEGWITSGSTTSNNSASASQSSETASLDRYIMKSVHGSAVSGSLPSSISGRTSGTYADIEIQPNGYLKIPAGYNPLDRYVYANKADTSGESRVASGYSLSVSSISGDGAVSVGTLASGYYPIVASNLSVTATLSASTAGWFSTGTANDSDTDNVTVGKMAAAAASVSGSTVAASPTIARSTTAVSGATNVASGDATTTVPGSGACYVAVQATAPATTISLTKNVSTKGYLDGTSQISASASTTAKTGSLYFVPVAKANVTSTAGSASATGGSASISVTGIKTVTTNTGYQISATATGGNASTTTSTLSIGVGYVTAGQTATVAAKSATGASSSTAVYIQKGILSASVSSNSSGSASIAATGFTALTGSNTSSYYITLSTSAGSVKAKASVGTEGYVKSETNETAATSVSVTGNGTKLYIPTTGVTASVSSNSSGSASIAATGFTALTGSNTSSYYITLSTSAGSVKAKAVGNGTGMISSSTSNETAATSVSVTGNGTKLYIPTNSITGSVVDLTAPKVAVSGAATGFTALTGTNTSSYYITVSGTGTNGSVKGKATAGGTTGVVAASATNTSAASTITPTITGSGTKVYIPTNTITGSVVDLTAPKVAVSGAVTGMTTTSTATSYYITVSGTGTNGSVKGKATAGGTTGVVAASATNTSAASTITPTITGSGTKIYIPASSHTISAISGGGVSCTFNAATSCSLSTTDTLNSGISFTFKGSRAAASVSSTATAGYTTGTSKTATLAAASANSSTYYIQGVTLAKPPAGAEARSFDITVPNGDVTITFRFSVDSSGNVTIAPPP